MAKHNKNAISDKGEASETSLEWLAVVLLIVLATIGPILVGKIINFAFPLASLAVGLFLYRRNSFLYVSFTWWLWFLTPLIRRFIDYHSGFTDPSPVLLTPIVVTLITFSALFEHLPKSHYSVTLPFSLSTSGVIYAFFTGLIQNSIDNVVISLLEWLSPIAFSFFLYIHWQDYISYRKTIQNTFLASVILMGTYGIFQYLVAPDWDRFWLINASVRSFGLPEPLGIRVWSTMNGPQVFACTLLGGLLLLFADRRPLKFLAAGVGYLSFLLSLARSAWLGWIVGLAVLIVSIKSSIQIRLIITIFLAALFIVPLTAIEPFSTVIGTRLDSFSNGQKDYSLQERTEGYQRLMNQAIAEFVGKGLGYKIQDRTIGAEDGTILPTLFSLGWIGTIPYLSGLLLMLIKVFQEKALALDPFASAARAIALGILSQAGFNYVVAGPVGLTLWAFLGISMAAQSYYKHTKIKSR